MKKIILVFLILSNISAAYSQDDDSPIKIEALYIGEYFSNFSGGLKTGQTYLGLMDIGIGFETKDLGLWKGGEFFALIENTHGGSPSVDYIGDLQVASNIENGDYTYLYELWYKQQFNKLGVKLGVLDLNTRCHVSSVGNLFLNSSFGIMPSASLNMPVPIFPVPALGIQFDYQFSERFKAVAGIWDGNPGNLEENRYNIQWKLLNNEGYLYIAEGKYDYSSNKSAFGKIKVGVLYHSGGFPTVNDDTKTISGNWQFHLITDHTIINKTEGERGKLDGFLQVGYLPDNSINQVPLYIGTGVNYTGLLYKEATDIIGLAFAYASLNTKTFHNSASYELAIELSYALPITNQIAIQPDLQCVINPSDYESLDNISNKNIENAFYGFLRLIIEH